MSTPPRVRLSDQRVRNLSVDELGLTLPPAATRSMEHGVSPPIPDDPTPLPASEPLLGTVEELLAQFGGVILVGPPGTSKTWYAARLAVTLAGNSTRVRFVQFHASYQYEDFVQGFVPKVQGGFELRPKHLVEMAEAAAEEPHVRYVLVIDELSRGDSARIFGEALTYVEKTKRGLRFSLASGDELAIPTNLVFLATMNALDRGVDDVDAAFERRFAKIAMEPDPAILAGLLTESGLPDPLRGRVIEFFRFINERARDEPQAALGHAYFLGVDGEAALERLWAHQLRFFFDKAYRLDPQSHREVRERWERIFS